MSGAAAGTRAGGSRLWVACMPWLFVLIWSTGFIVAKYGMPYAEPMTFLFLRFAGVLVFMLPFVLLARVPLPQRQGRTDWRKVGHLALAGLFLQAGYGRGLGRGQAGHAGRRVGADRGHAAGADRADRHAAGRAHRCPAMAGLLCGIAGVGLVVANKLTVAGMSPASLLLALGALLCITIGTLYQKRYCPVFDLRIGSVIQFAASALACLPFMFLFETREVQWTAAMVCALLWSVLALSIGAISLLFVLLRQGAATRVSSLMYLTPPTTAVMARLLFGERFPPLAALGMALAVAG